MAPEVGKSVARLIFVSFPEGQRATRAVLFLVAVALLAGCASEDHAPLVLAREVLFHAGDLADGASPELDDSAWQRVQLAALQGQPSIFWMRAEIPLTERHARGDEPLAMWFSGMATCEFFWNGEPLPGEGRPGADAASERPGPLDVLTYLPTSVVFAGDHLLAARCSTHHRGFEPRVGFYALGVGPYVPLSEGFLAYVWTGLASLTGKLVAAVYFLALFFARRRSKPALFLALLSLSAAGLLVAEAWRALVGYTYDWHLPRLLVVLALAACCSATLLLYLLSQFPARGRLWVGLGALGLSTVLVFQVRGMDGKVAWVLFIGLMVSLGWGLAAVLRRRPGSVLATAGVGLCVLVFAVWPERFVDLGVFFALDGLLVCLLVAQVQKARRERDQLEAARMRATRLELELVKKSIQPHFLMNTLTALAECFEREPSVAGKAIDALAREVRLLGDLAGQTVVPLGSELELCRAHLDVMALRRGGAYRLAVEGVDPEEPCPPGILHTMVENAVTHGPAPGSAEVVLELSGRDDGGERVYRFSSPLADGAEKEPEREGTGLRYVKTRLLEAFGEEARFLSGARDGSWINEWRVPGSAALAARGGDSA